MNRPNPSKSVWELESLGIQIEMRMPQGCPQQDKLSILRQAELLMNMVANVNADRPASEEQDIVEQIDVKREAN